MENYNKIAAAYDSLFLDAGSREENNAVREMLLPYVYKRKIVDIGCGTGLFLDLFPEIEPKNYTGVDPSIRMLQRLLEKHPEFEDSILCAKYEQTFLPKPGLSVSLFGSINYINSNKVLFATTLAPYFYMFYKPNYSPITYKKSGVTIKHYDYTKDKLHIFFENVLDFNNFHIVTNLF